MGQDQNLRCFFILNQDNISKRINSDTTYRTHESRLQNYFNEVVHYFIMLKSR
jgi:hypothetical protein